MRCEGRRARAGREQHLEGFQCAFIDILASGTICAHSFVPDANHIVPVQIDHFPIDDCEFLKRNPLLTRHTNLPIGDTMALRPNSHKLLRGPISIHIAFPRDRSGGCNDIGFTPHSATLENAYFWEMKRSRSLPKHESNVCPPTCACSVQAELANGVRNGWKKNRHAFADRSERLNTARSTVGFEFTERFYKLNTEILNLCISSQTVLEGWATNG